MKNPDFNEVYNLYFQDVFKFLTALCHDDKLAEELTQETFFKALKNYDTFRGDCKVTSWLFQIAKNAYFLQQKQSGRTISIDSIDTEIAENGAIEVLIERRETAFSIHKRLHDLPEPYKEVFSLRVFGELSYHDISRLFGRTEDWARVTFYRAKLKLIEQLKEEEDD